MFEKFFGKKKSSEKSSKGSESPEKNVVNFNEEMEKRGENTLVGKLRGIETYARLMLREYYTDDEEKFNSFLENDLRNYILEKTNDADDEKIEEISKKIKLEIENGTIFGKILKEDQSLESTGLSEKGPWSDDSPQRVNMR